MEAVPTLFRVPLIRWALLKDPRDENYPIITGTLETMKLREVKKLGQCHIAWQREAGASCGMFWGPKFLQFLLPPIILFFV